MQDKYKFTIEDLTAKGFVEEKDGGEVYLVYTNNHFPAEINYLVATPNKYEEYIVSYGYRSKFGKFQRTLEKLDEELINLFIREINISITVDEWFEKLICR